MECEKINTKTNEKFKISNNDILIGESIIYWTTNLSHSLVYCITTDLHYDTYDNEIVIYS